MSQSVTSRIVKGVGASAFGQFVNIVIQVAGLPILIGLWGKEKYGEWLLLSSAAQLLAMSDVGLFHAAANDMAMRIGKGDREDALCTLHSTWLALTGMSLVIWPLTVVLVWLTPLVGWSWNLTLIPLTDAQWLLTLLSAYVLLSFQTGAYDACFRADSRFSLGVMISSTARLVEFVAQMSTLLVTRSMIKFVVAGLIVKLLTLLVQRLLLHKFSPWITISWRDASWPRIKKLAGPALGFFGMPLGTALSLQGMVQLVGYLLGPAAVTVLNVHRSLCNFLIQMMSLANHAIWPEVSRAFGAGDFALTRRLHHHAGAATLWMTLLGSLGLLATAGWIIPFWSTGDVATHYGLLLGCLAASVCRALWGSSAVVPMATNRNGVVSLLFIAAMGLSLALTYVVTPWWGLTGAGVSLFCAELVMAFCVLRIALRLTNDSARPYLRSLLRPPLEQWLRLGRSLGRAS